MESVHDERFVVFVRQDCSHSKRPDLAERPLMTFSNYDDARRVQRHLLRTARESVIRYVGPTGGGD